MRLFAKNGANAIVDMIERRAREHARIVNALEAENAELRERVAWLEAIVARQHVDASDHVGSEQ